MIYYIDVQPIRKKNRSVLKKMRACIYPAALLISSLFIIPFSFNSKEPLYNASISAADLNAPNTLSSADITEKLSVSAFKPFSSPLDNAYISSRYGYRTNPVSGKYKLHGGLDLACSEGTPIYAVMDGEVVASAYSESYGNYIKIDHKNGYQTLYAHCSKLISSKGNTVCCGDTIALVGSTGNSTGPHLHIEVRHNGERIDPEIYFGDFFQ